MKPNKRINIHNAVETSIDLAKDNKIGTWEGINNRVRKGLIRWEDIYQDELIDELKKISHPAIEPCDEIR